MKLRFVAPALVCFVALPALADWPSLRGPEMDGRAKAPGTFAGATVGLGVGWKVPVGSAYSGIAVGKGKAVTMFAGDDADWIAAFDVADGKQVWKQRLGDKTRGHDGSDDGPLSTPVIGGDRVYAVAPAGRVLALRLADGTVVWEKNLEKDFGGKKPDYGFTTTPALADDVLVIQAGGSDKRSIVGLAVKDGSQLWSHGEARVDYQSPVVMTLAGKRQVVAVARGAITGLDPETGAVLWTQALGDQDWAGSSTPTSIGDDRFMVTVSGKGVAYRVSQTDGVFAVGELYRSEALGGDSYVPPVLHEGHLYGFRGQILSCVDAATGNLVWRSRPPGGDGLILVDGHLVIFAGKGHVAVAKAVPTGYTEVATLKVLDGSSLTWPSFDSNRIFVRNLSEMAAVEIRGTASPAPATAMDSGTHDFGRWLAGAKASKHPQAAVDQLMTNTPKAPILEEEYVHFVLRSPAAKDVGIQGTMNETENAEPMQRLAGTDLFYRTYKLVPGARWEYRYQVDFDKWITDPLNQRTVPEVEGDAQMSEVLTHGYKGAAYFDEPQGPRGKLEEFTLASKILGYEKKVQVWVPPGYESGDEKYPLLVVNDGTAWLERGNMATALDNLVGRSVQPMVVAFVPSDRRWWLEAGGSRTGDYVRMQIEELIPELEKRYRLAQGPASRAVMGNRFYGTTSAYTALKHPDVFGKVAAQSVYLGLGVEQELQQLIRAKAGTQSKIYLDWNRFDVRNVDREWDMAADSRALAEQLRAGGYTMEGGEMLDSWGWGGWRNRTDRILSTLFPL